MRTVRKSPVLVLAPLAGVGLVLGLVILPQMRGWVVVLQPALLVAAMASAAIWTVVLLWAIHHLGYQLVGLIPRRPQSTLVIPSRTVRFAVLYMTCDDFLPACCDSCLAQVYPAEAFQVFVCDDSVTDTALEEVSAFCSTQNSAFLVRRATRKGFKAGNLNHAIRQAVGDKWEWVVIVDADQMLPTNYLSDLARHADAQPPSVAFLQAGREPVVAPPTGDTPDSGVGPSPFQQALQIEMILFFERDFAPRAAFGVLSFLGHGGAVRRTAWEAVGGFPEVVSEDFAFAMRARSIGQHGALVDSVRSQESHPKDFGAFVTRWAKFTGGAAELLRFYYPRFLLGKAGSFTERYDAGLLLVTFALLPLYLVNLFLSAYLCHRFHESGVVVPARPLSFLFLTMLLISASMGVSVTPNVFDACRFWFWSYAVYMAALPSAAGRLIWHLFFRPEFDRTPKGTARSARFPVTGAMTVLLGWLALTAAWQWWSPFRLVLASAGIAFVSFPLYRYLHQRQSIIGSVARSLVYAPGLTFLVAFREMWLWH